MTGVCARLAMFVAVTLTFGGAGFADIGADTADVAQVVRTAAHEARGSPADRRAIAIQPNALGHRLHMRFVQAGITLY